MNTNAKPLGARARLLQIVPLAAAALLLLFALQAAFRFLRPVGFSIDEPVDCISFGELSDRQPRGRVADAEELARLVELLNESAFHEPALRSEADSPCAAHYSTVQFYSGGETVCTLLVTGSREDFAQIRIYHNGKELVPYRRKKIVSQLFRLCGW